MHIYFRLTQSRPPKNNEKKNEYIFRLKPQIFFHQNHNYFRKKTSNYFHSKNHKAKTQVVWLLWLYNGRD